MFTTKNFKPQLYARLIELLLTVVCFVLPFYMRTHSVCRMSLKYKPHDLAFLRTLSQQLVYVNSHTCLSFLFVVVGLFGRCSISICICWCVLGIHSLLLLLFSLYMHYLSLGSCSFCLLFVALKNIRTFQFA